MKHFYTLCFWHKGNRMAFNGIARNPCSQYYLSYNLAAIDLGQLCSLEHTHLCGQQAIIENFLVTTRD